MMLTRQMAERKGGALSVTKTIINYAYVCARDARRCPTKHVLNGCGCKSRMVVAVGSAGISGHDSKGPGRVGSGDSGSAGGEGLETSSCLPC